MEFNSQICTTREQSERLIALGLKKETADMYLLIDHFGNYQPATLCDFMFSKDQTTPAWSLHRLIEMADTYIEFSPFTGVNFQDGSFDANRDNDYDAIVDIVEWLIKKEQFNKKYLEE